MNNPNAQSMHKKNTKSYKMTRITIAIVLIASLAFAGFAIFSVHNIAKTVEDKIVAAKGGIPETWKKVRGTSVIESEIVSRIINSDYIEYTVKVKNTDENAVSLTNIAAYFSDGKNYGFIPLSDKSLEYTYVEKDNNSWVSQVVTEPTNNSDGFKLENKIYLGAEGSETDTVYFRYVVEPMNDGGVVSNKVAILISEDGSQTMSTAESEVEYTKTDDVRLAAEDIARENPAEVFQDPNDDSGEYTKPLGVVSEPTSTVFHASALGAIGLAPDELSNNIIIVVAALGTFAIALVAYLVMHHNTKRAA